VSIALEHKGEIVSAVVYDPAKDEMFYVAAGRYDGYWERGLNIWDIAGGVLLVKEAGGFVEPIRDGQNLLEDGHLICANPEIFPAFAKVIRARN